MSSAEDMRLQRLLGGDDLTELRRRLRRHFERADPLKPQSVIRLGDLSPREYEALASFAGRPARQARSTHLNIAELDAALVRAGIAHSLKAALEAIDGPIIHAATARSEVAARWDAVIDRARHPSLASFLRSANGLGRLKRLAKHNPYVAEQLSERAALVLARLPVDGRPRAQIAAETLGDAHALDGGQPVATLVLATLRQGIQVSAESADTDLIEDERDRAVWARSGVLVNELARPALHLNLPWQDVSAHAARPGEPAYASLRFLLRRPPTLDVASRTVYVCENPNLVAIAAHRLGTSCAPLVCTDGMPAAAQRTLLALLARAGAHLVYHGDFDWPGLRIANHVMQTFGARPWRFNADDYTEIAADTPGQALAGATVEASWDGSLTHVMVARGLAFAEEVIADVLLHDLRS